MTTYWPGTNIVKSQGNAFTSWKTSPSHVFQTKEWKQAEAARRAASTQAGKPFTIYSRARASK